MKKLIIILLCSLSLITYSATYNSIVTGNWTTASSWQSGSIPPLSGNNVTIYINSGDVITLNNSITFNNNCQLYVFGTLIINQDFIVNNNLYIEVTGDLIIDGNFSANNNADLTITNTGTTSIAGDATFNTNADIVLNGNLSIDGTLSGSGTNNLTGDGVLTVGGGAGGFNTGGFSGVIIDPLPIELLKFEGYEANKWIYFNWVTGCEINNAYFVIEKSYDGLSFEDIIQLNGSGDTNDKMYYTYSYNDSYAGRIYYRLKQIDYDGLFTYSDIIVVNNIGFNYNIVNDHLTISSDKDLIIKLYNINGTPQYIGNCKNLNIGLTRNIYLMHIYDKDKLIYADKFVIR